MVNNILRFLRRFFRAQEAVSALEYAILVGVIVAGVGAALLVFTDDIQKAMTGIGDQVAATGGTAKKADLSSAETVE